MRDDSGRLARVPRGLLLAASLALAGPLATPAMAQQPSAYVVVVDYTADAAHFEQLKTMVEAVARASIAEPGCQRFDVVAPSGAPNHLTLYELFDSKAAFDAHAAAPHFKAFAADSAAIGATRVAVPGSMLLSLHKP